jgi:ribosomal protein S2
MLIYSKNLISVCGHIGLHKYNWQPESERFAIGYRSSILIYNLSNSSFYLNRALNFVEKLIYKFGRVYIYGLLKTKDKKFINKLTKINQVVCIKPWRGGFVTNARTFRKRIKNIRKRFSAVISLTYDYQNYSLPREAFIINLPSVSVVDSNAKADSFTYPIPINSSNNGVVRLLAYNFGIRIFKGLSKRILSRFAKKIKVSRLKGKIKTYFKKKFITRVDKSKKLRKIKAHKILKKWTKKFKNIKFKDRLKQKEKRAELRKLARKFKKLFKFGAKKKKKKKTSHYFPFEKKPEPKPKKRKPRKRHYKKHKKKFKFINRRWRRPRFRRKTTQFARIKQKLTKLNRLNKFRRFFPKLMKNRNSKFIVRKFKLGLRAYKFRNIYSFLRIRKKKIILLKRIKKKRFQKYLIKQREKNKANYRTIYHGNMVIKRIRKRKSYFPSLF